MRKTNLKQLGWVFIALILVMGCTKSPKVEPIDVEQQSLSPTQKNVSMMNTAAIGLLDLSQHKAFRSKVHQYAKAAFDDDTNVLLKTLHEDEDLLQSMETSINKYQDKIY